MTITDSDTGTDTADPLLVAQEDFRDSLIAAGLLVPLGIDGLYGRSADFERIIEGIDRSIQRRAHEIHGDRAVVLRFPPVYSRESFERTDFIASFPDLTGAVATFAGGDREHQQLLADRAAGCGWDDHLHPSDTMLVSAACHPSYASVPSPVGPDGHLMDILGYCFRHEPSADPARMMAFRMHEYVLVGSPEQARRHRNGWIEAGLQVLTDLGLDAAPAAANDPFFGRAGRLLATNQRTEELKYELVVRLYGELNDGTAVVSANCHETHFGDAFGLTTADGRTAHSACVGFGMERIALAMLRTHGFDLAVWPSPVRAHLGWP